MDSSPIDSNGTITKVQRVKRWLRQGHVSFWLIMLVAFSVVSVAAWSYLLTCEQCDNQALSPKCWDGLFDLLAYAFPILGAMIAGGGFYYRDKFEKKELTTTTDITDGSQADPSGPKAPKKQQGDTEKYFFICSLAFLAVGFALYVLAHMRAAGAPVLWVCGLLLICFAIGLFVIAWRTSSEDRVAMVVAYFFSFAALVGSILIVAQTRSQPTNFVCQVKALAPP